MANKYAAIDSKYQYDVGKIGFKQPTKRRYTLLPSLKSQIEGS